MYYTQLTQAPRCHYLVVWSDYGVEILNCSQRVTKTDKVLALMTKEQYYRYENLFQSKARSLQTARESIEEFWDMLRKENDPHHPLPCNYESFEDYMSAYGKQQQEWDEIFRKNLPFAKL